MKKKRAEADPMHVAIGAILVIIVLVVSVVIFTKYHGKETKQLKCQLERVSCDCDNDGVANPVDPCPTDQDNKKKGCLKTDDIKKGGCFDYEKCECRATKK